jgi:hypothetical protein
MLAGVDTDTDQQDTLKTNKYVHKAALLDVHKHTLHVANICRCLFSVPSLSIYRVIHVLVAVVQCFVQETLGIAGASCSRVVVVPWFGSVRLVRW